MVQLPAITSSQMWWAAGLTAAVDAGLALLLTRHLRRPGRGLSSRVLLGVGVVAFAAILTWAFRSYWDVCYGFALPPAMRSLAPLVGAGLGGVGWLFWHLARHAGRWAVPVFLALGGLESVPGHLNAIYRFDLLDRCPLIHGISPASALVFGVFEFGFYWSVVTALSVALSRLPARRGASGAEAVR